MKARVTFLFLPLLLMACANGMFRSENSLRQEYEMVLDGMIGKDKSQVAAILGKPDEVKQAPGGGEDLLFGASVYSVDKMMFMPLPSQARNDCMTSISTDSGGKVKSYTITGETCGIAFMHKVNKVKDQSK